jgi:2-oxoglutarate dehydrogenase E1 component
MMMQSRGTSFLYGGNAPYVEEQYELYLEDPASVAEEWRNYFDKLASVPAVDGGSGADVAHYPVIRQFEQFGKGKRLGDLSSGGTSAGFRKQVAVQSLIMAYRMLGTRKADLDPLRWTPIAAIPDLSPAYYGLTNEDMARKFSTADTYFWEEDQPLSALVTALEETYCGTIGSEFMHLTDAGQRRWWQMRLESTRARPTLSTEQKVRILEGLTAAEGLEKYLHVRYAGQKRFSLEGGDSLIPLLNHLVQYGATKGIGHVVMGMAHRGRLNVLVNVVGKPAADLFDEFNGRTAGLLPAGDVKYHKGYSGFGLVEDDLVEVVLAFNPSHLEIVNPVVQGLARAMGESPGAPDHVVLPVEIHGDVAITGQGIVMETLSLTHTPSYGTGGTIHIVINNQVGFTTSDPRETRSSFYCTDIAKMIEMPVLHVNGDDPEAVVTAVQWALDFRQEYRQSVMIDLVCFRRHGHQEQDTPAITQPLMYRAIAANPGVRLIYAKALVESSIVTAEQVEEMAHAYRGNLEWQQAASEGRAVPVASSTASVECSQRAAQIYYAAPDAGHIRKLATQVTAVPPGFELHPLVTKVISARREMAAGDRPLDWGMAEHLAFATLLAAGIPVRLSGEDAERGTFAHRHAVLNHQDRSERGEGRYIPLDHLDEAQGRFTVINSILSEAAVMAFEYGYSIGGTGSLVLWEAQFGDFANGAQVVIDQFISAAAAKWGQQSGLTLLLPHGQEGQGPEHASARLERYLQLCAQNNMRVCQPTTPAQYFHLLRMQATLPDRCPLIIMTPKSMLRAPNAVSSLEELSQGSFREVLGDSDLAKDDAAHVTRAIICSGKVFYELLQYRLANKITDTALIRIEQLYPFPSAQLDAELARYKNLKSLVWCQEEAKNQGPWKVIDTDLQAIAPAPVELRYAGPPPAASTAPGNASTHTAIQKAVVLKAFGQ